MISFNYPMCFIILLFSCRNTSNVSNILPIIDSVDISAIHQNPNYKRYGLKTEYVSGTFYLLVESLGDFYAVNNSGEILWKISLNKYLDGPDGPSIQYTSMQDFILGDNSIYFLQNDKSIVEYNLGGNRKEIYPLQIEQPGNAIALRHLSDTRFILLWHESFKPDYTSEYTVFEIDLGQSSSTKIFNRKLSYPRSRIVFDVSEDGIYVFEDANSDATFIATGDSLPKELPVAKSKWRDYTVRKVYQGDISTYQGMDVFERTQFLNDYYKQAKIVADHVFLHHYVFQRSEAINPFKDLITVQLPDGTNEDILLQDQVLNLDDHGNYFSIQKNEKGVFLSISPILDTK